MDTEPDTILDLTGTTKDIEDSHIGDNTRNTYVRTLVDFMVFLFHSHPLLLVDLEVLREQNSRGGQKDLKRRCKILVQLINRTDHNSPIRLTGDNDTLTYAHIASFMNTKRKVLEVNADVAAKLAEKGGSVLDVEPDEANQVKVAVRLGDSSYTAVQSAVSFLFRQSGVERSAEVKGGVSLYCKGSK